MRRLLPRMRQEIAILQKVKSGFQFEIQRTQTGEEFTSVKLHEETSLVVSRDFLNRATTRN